ncbi:hypothetical protein TVAG_146790 [Trichomonas vaginalis G3]|uniref:receptor protein-tyrosine kinase n=1 Tax=Trichomonas vaginalis (strain ATCC PRA-98 / G3) TaxID=412133 RepID=A2DKY3_TRIV3|nr:glycine-rich protein family [Trichomonas vaginalis G3]EAY18936.1 hypothetical protein TVAG_146790 [Trichomonas vaginalis G3]KAI5532002.1 glycine-rich protein family [Trichomonas vaginalis G3]|eukprot:XP_001579922.1 hypothetical protein [Trichomonas vaginalis G3]
MPRCKNIVYGGGGIGDLGGGGASDIRLIGGEYGNFSSLKSRIIVAGAGAGSDTFGIGGPGGGLIGMNASNNKSTGGTQTQGGYGIVNGTFGFGGGFHAERDGSGSGGGGYFGGGSSIAYRNEGGGGGSSYISGHPGCISVLENSTSQNEIYFSQENNPSIHYSGIRFIKTLMIDGSSEMMSPYNKMESHGHFGNGFIKITRFSCNAVSCNCLFRNYYQFNIILISVFILM